ncbi:hypothetical protein ACFB49_33380 [Sphingomonas sp. DBB INV C78]|uniref:hypothetical protein n=1 Tax=Sphingomonas sp. DBB INV C78 TaxID=3349434 RepID=UPI0036D25F1B
MNPSSVFCRAQEALQLERAAGASLANVRLIAEKAAASWKKEALNADKREQRFDRRLIATGMAKEQVSQGQGDRTSSENPDRGFAST